MFKFLFKVVILVLGYFPLADIVVWISTEIFGPATFAYSSILTPMFVSWEVIYPWEYSIVCFGICLWAINPYRRFYTRVAISCLASVSNFLHSLGGPLIKIPSFPSEVIYLK